MTGDNRADVVIAGGGFAGLALAVALRQALGENFAVMLVDPDLGAEDVRASAIAAAPRRMFEALGAWDAIAEDAQPIRDMVVTDSRADDSVRPVFLTFTGDVEPGEPFAHMIENSRVLTALLAQATSGGVGLVSGAVADFTVGPHETLARLTSGAVIATKLLVGADGARSRLRAQAGIAYRGWFYGQSAIVTTVAHERDHGGRAEEHFLPAGPFAILPLRGKRCSIVWTEDSAEAARILALPDEDFHDALEKRFGLRLGEIVVAGPRRTYPLGLWMAREFVGERLALVGDAAHVIHPIAGQGLNMGLRDVAALAEAVVDATRLGLEAGDVTVLERYQRWRRFDTLMMGASTDALNRLFSNRSDALRLFRDIGLGLVDRLPALKQVFIREAAGFTGAVPRLLRGEAL
jgi:2-octaprenyl-6-methoxyphenol hydroxylase